MRLLSIAGKDLLQVLRDWKSTLFLVVMPLAFKKGAPEGAPHVSRSTVLRWGQYALSCEPPEIESRPQVSGPW
jgi:hypothetical protein